VSEAKPYSKEAQLGPSRSKRYRRKVATAKQWAALIEAKCSDRCRTCGDSVARSWGTLDPHHLVSRSDGGDDIADNIIGLCRDCHDKITRRDPVLCIALLSALEDGEYAYMIGRGGEDYPERAYGIRYGR